MNYTRNLKDRVEMALGVSPVVLLTGARQTGKTTLVKELGELHGFNYVSFDDLTFLAGARNDPAGFLSNLSKPLILDEVQRVPEIILPIKLDVDIRNLPGQYILTGSANPLVVPKLNDSLAGRMIVLNLWPFSRGEFLRKKETFLDTIFHPDWMPGHYATWAQTDMLDVLISGGYPRMQNLLPIMRREWCNSHLMTILERDAQDISNITRLKELPFLIQLLAARTSQLFNVAEVGRVAGIPYATITLYLHLLEALFLMVRQPAWHTNRSKRLVKMPKLYLADTGLLCYLLGVDQEALTTNTTLLGQILENFVVQELRKQSTWSEKQIRLYHFRTTSGAEVDIVLEDSRGNVVGIEIKNSGTVRAHDFKGLEALAEDAGEQFIRGIVFYTGDAVVPFGKNLFALPMSGVWS